MYDFALQIFFPSRLPPHHRLDTPHEVNNCFEEDPSAAIQKLPWSQPRPPDVRILRKKQSDTATALVGESLSHRQQTDTELGTVVRFRLSSERPPTRTSIQSESELTKKLVTKWNRLCIENGLVYLKDKPAKKRRKLSAPTVVTKSGC